MRLPICAQRGLTAFMLTLFAGLPAQAADVDGAWANDPAACSNIFVKKNNVVSLADDSDIYGSGFIVDGNRIRGKMATCTIKSRKEDAGVVHLIAVCSTDIALSTVQFSLRMDGENKLTRFFPGVPEMDVSYVRCPP